MRLPRYIADGIEPELHIFSDASNYCFAASAYLRVKKGNTYHTNLIFAKARIKPIDKPSKKKKVGDWKLPTREVEALSCFTDYFDNNQKLEMSELFPKSKNNIFDSKENKLSLKSENNPVSESLKILQKIFKEKEKTRKNGVDLSLLASKNKFFENCEKERPSHKLENTNISSERNVNISLSQPSNKIDRPKPSEVKNISDKREESAYKNNAKLSPNNSETNEISETSEKVNISETEEENARKNSDIFPHSIHSKTILEISENIKISEGNSSPILKDNSLEISENLKISEGSGPISKEKSLENSENINISEKEKEVARKNSVLLPSPTNPKPNLAISQGAVSQTPSISKDKSLEKSETCKTSDKITERELFSAISDQWTENWASENETDAGKGLTIPKLELAGILVASRLAATLSKDVGIPIKRSVLWTDSMVALHWVNSPRVWKTWVQNRVQEIKGHKKSLNFDLNYVPTEVNPGDIASRGQPYHDLTTNKMWWHGPEFLNKETELWPKQPEMSTFSKEEAEEVIFTMKTTSIRKPFLNKVFDHDRTNDLQRLKHQVIGVYRFLKINLLSRVKTSKTFLKKQKVWAKTFENKGPATQSEYDWATIVLVRQAQTEDPPDQDLIQNLGLYKDDNNLWRCTGRLGRSDLDSGAKYPIFLPKNHHITHMLIYEVHVNNLHPGFLHTLSLVRDRYWVPQGIQIVRKVLHKWDVRCKRHHNSSYKLPLMPPVPRERLTFTGPFSNIGLDYAGPFEVKDRAGPTKIWICLISCNVTRAVYLDIAVDNSTGTFIQLLDRFISRRGCPDKIYSDNAKSFVLMNEILQKYWDSNYLELQNYANTDSVNLFFKSKGIEWEFITPLAPWQGGHYERLIGIVKLSLYKCLGKNKLGIEQFRTLLAGIEAMVNTRPLTFMSDSLEAASILRPVDLINPKSQNPGFPYGTPDVTYDDKDYELQSNYRERVIEVWNKIQTHFQKFWELFLDLYIKDLRTKHVTSHRGQYRNQTRLPVVGEIALLCDAMQSRGQWRLCKVVGLSLGPDGLCRSATILMGNGKTLSRPINHITPLEIADQIEIDDNEAIKRLELDGNIPPIKDRGSSQNK